MSTFFSKKLASNKPSVTLSLNEHILTLQAQGIPITNLTLGEPDLPTPQHICEAACRAIKEGFTKYTNVKGIQELREATIQHFTSYSTKKLSCSQEEVIISNGAKQALYNLFQVLINPGDEVLIPAPYWTSYPEMVLLSGGIPVIIPTDPKTFKLTPELLEQALTKRTKILLFNAPANPTGLCYKEQEADSIFQWAVKNNLFIISDEVYAQLVFPPYKPTSMIHWWTQYPEQIAIVSSLSKMFSMTGWRIGFTIANRQTINQLSQIQGHTTSSVCSIAQKAAVAALTGSTECFTSMRKIFQSRRDSAWDEISSWPDISCNRPDGAFYFFPNISKYFTKKYPNSSALCAMLIKKAYAALVPGDAFGAPEHIRLSFTIEENLLLDALHRIREVLLTIKEQ